MGEAGPVTSFPDELGKRLAERWLVVPDVLIEAGVVVAGRFGGGLVVARASGWHRRGDGDPRAVGETGPVTPFFDELGKKRDEPWLSRWGRARCLIATVAAGRGQVSSVTPFFNGLGRELAARWLSRLVVRGSAFGRDSGPLAMGEAGPVTSSSHGSGRKFAERWVVPGLPLVGTVVGWRWGRAGR
ncbi:hypothetical protein [Actinokineospora sp. UTMC 2448]|uniref:hypothetical protein n=1 Tax=Actinokineospora sp. UTMC 2448 TaxID=2268449 RepID=UPI002164457C|nr:hypothetical protein [Actinokineospora sp. UTMC 2448]